MARKSIKRRNKRRGTSKMQNQQFSRKLFKAIAKGLTRKQKIFGGAELMRSEFIKVTSNGATESGKRKIDSVDFITNDESIQQELTDFSKFAKDYFSPNNNDILTLYLPVIFIVDSNGHRTGLKMINFGSEPDNTEFIKLKEQINAVTTTAAVSANVIDNRLNNALSNIVPLEKK